MCDFFLNRINELFNLIMQPIDSMYKFTAVNNFKKELEIDGDSTFGEKFYCLMGNDKSSGVVYTPHEISEYMLKSSICEEQVIDNPFLRVADPSCGVGNMIIPCYKYLKTIFCENLEKINEIHDLNLACENIGQFIVEKNLYGFDIDFRAIQVLCIDLFCESGCINADNFHHGDFLACEGEKFDVFIGNPPYVGHKTISRDYASFLKEKYRNVYKDKGDLSYCFFQNAIMNLTKGGRLSFITSRYFIESPSGEELRKMLKEFSTIEKIVDFYGIRPFKNVGIDPLMIFLKNELSINESIQIIKPENSGGNSKKNFMDSLFRDKGSACKKFFVSKTDLNDKGWILRDEDERDMIHKIETKSFTSIGNICDTYQGIITGCDKAFIVKEEEMLNEQLEECLMKPWIKSSNIEKNKVSSSNLKLINSDLVDDLEKYPKVKEHVTPYKEKLSQRRECARGSRKWYQLQWGRAQNVFEGKKIVFPYKASSNRFALDSGSYFSADVYCLRLKEDVPFVHEFLLALLNSKVYEFYFKTFAKKLGDSMYEYYPNNIVKICVPTMGELYELNTLYEQGRYEEVDSVLYKYFEFNEEEINIIEKSVL